MGKIMKLSEPKLSLVDHGIGQVELRILHQVAHLGGLADGDRPLVRLDLAHEHLEERGLARAVVADEADALVLVNGEVEFFKEHFLAEMLFDVRKGSDGHFNTYSN